MKASELEPLRPGIVIVPGSEVTQFIRRKTQEIDDNRARLNDLLLILQEQEQRMEQPT